MIHEAHARIRGLLDALGLETRRQRLDAISAILGRSIDWAYEITAPEVGTVVGELDRRVRAASTKPCGCTSDRLCPQHWQVKPRGSRRGEAG